VLETALHFFYIEVNVFALRMMKMRILGLLLSLLLTAFAQQQGLREEQLASKAGAFWKEWSHVWDGSVEDAEIAQHLATTASLVLDESQSTHQNLLGPFQLHDRTPSQRIISGREQTLEAFRAWPTTWSKGTLRRSKFKVVGVEVNGQKLTTTELVAVLVDGQQTWEYNGRWQTTWTIQGEELLFEKSQALEGMVAAVSGQAIFEEKTSGLLPEAAGSDLELTEENFYWRERIPASFEPDQFGETGVSVADVNGDGLEDVYLCQIGGLRNRLWLRTAEGRLVEAPESGLEIRENTCAALFVDLDADGDRDALLTTTSGIVLFANDGKGIFTERQRFSETRYGFGAAACDYDQDGDVDLFVCQYYSDEYSDPGAGGAAVRGAFPGPYPVYDAKNGGTNVLLRNEGAWKFVDVTNEAGLGLNNSRYSYTCLWEDFDNDGDQDLFVVNDFGPNNFYLNQGGGKFIDRSNAPGVKDGGFGMGITASDFDLDGRYDLHISNMYSGAGNRIARQDWFHADKDQKVRETLLSLARGNTLLKNLGQSAFTDSSETSGIAMGRWSWSSLAVDLNNDTREDILVANGFVTGKDPDDL